MAAEEKTNNAWEDMASKNSLVSDKILKVNIKKSNLMGFFRKQSEPIYFFSLLTYALGKKNFFSINLH